MMEAVIVIAAVLMVIVLLDAGCQIALCLVRWAPSAVFGLFLGWLAHRHGAQAREAVWVAAFATLITKRLRLPISLHDENHWI